LIIDGGCHAGDGRRIRGFRGIHLSGISGNRRLERYLVCRIGSRHSGNRGLRYIGERTRNFQRIRALTCDGGTGDG
jgi:hypothetical protein